MRNFLLGAKYFAQQEQSVCITIEHLQASLACMEAVDRKGYEKLLNILKVEESNPKHAGLTIDILKTVADTPMVKYSPEVYEIIQKLKFYNYDRTTQITEPCLNGVARMGTYHKVVAEVSEMKALLASKVFGQAHAVEVVSDAVMQRHRAYKNPEAVTKQIRTQLQELVNEHPEHKIVCISALAAGADQEVARIALSEFAAELWVVTPFPLELYMEDFKGEEEAFNTLLNQATQYLEMPLRFGSVTQVASEPHVRNSQYALAGAFVAARAHQLVAVWDGLEARGKGGTAEVVSWAQDQKLPQSYAFTRLLHKPLAQLNIIRVER